MPTHQEVIEGLVARAEAAEADLRAAATALVRHGRHDWSCAIYDLSGALFCSCCYEDALRRAQTAAARVTR